MELLIELLILIVAARVAGEIAQRFKQPAIIGEIIVGIILGPTLFGVLQHHSSLQILADLGMFFLMFVVGLHSRLENMVKVLKPSILIGLLGTLIPLGAGYWLGLALGYSTKASLFIGIAFSMTAVAVKAKILSDIGIAQTKIGQIVVGTAIFDNIFSLIIFAVLVPAKGGGAANSGLPLLILKVLLFFVLSAVLGYLLVPLVSPLISKLQGTGMVFSFSLLIAFLFGEIAQVSGLHAIIGAFLAGLFISEEAMGTKLYDKLQDAYSSITFGFLAPVFVVWLAFPMKLDIFITSPIKVALIIVAGIVTKLIGSFIGALLSGMSLNESTVASFGMNGRGAVELVIAELGRRLGILDPALFSMLIIMAILSSLFTSVTLNLSKDWIKSQLEEARLTIREKVELYLTRCNEIFNITREAFGQMKERAPSAQQMNRLTAIKSQCDTQAREMLRGEGSTVHEGRDVLRAIVHLKRATDCLESIVEGVVALPPTLVSEPLETLQGLGKASLQCFPFAEEGFQLYYKNPDKISQLFEKVGEIESRSDALYDNFIEQLHKLNLTTEDHYVLNQLADAFESLADDVENILESLTITAKLARAKRVEMFPIID